MKVIGTEIEQLLAKTIEAVSYVATASPLLFNCLQPSDMGSSGNELVGYGFRLSYARWRNRFLDSNSNCIMANPCSLCKLLDWNSSSIGTSIGTVLRIDSCSPSPERCPQSLAK